jgi:hypothetical protein
MSGKDWQAVAELVPRVSARSGFFLGTEAQGVGIHRGCLTENIVKGEGACASVRHCST